MALTKLQNMVDPEVMAAMISAELPNAIRFAPLAQVDTTLVGQPGSTITFPAWKYIGDAQDVAEGAEIPLDELGTTTKEATIKKAAKGVEITDEAILSGLGDPLGEANRQLLLAIANKVDNDILEVLQGDEATQKVSKAPTTVQALQEAIDVFSHEDDEAMTLVVNPADASALRTDAQKNYMFGSELGSQVVIRGAIGEILGVTIVRSNKLKKGEAILVKQGAIKLVMKRGVSVEADRDIVRKTTVITADEHYAPYLYDPTRVVQMKAGA